jgi:hypothetical protein
MKSTWKDKDYKYWQYPRPVSQDMVKLWNFCELVRKQYPHIWRQGGNLVGNSAYRILSKVIKQGYFTGKETIKTEKGRQHFVTVWQGWMARHSKDYLLPGLIANLKWLSIPERGWDHTYGVLYRAMNDPELKKKANAKRIIPTKKVKRK